MHIEEFELERLQSVWENRVRYNLTESGVHPYTVRELLQPEEIESLLDVRLGYGWTNGDPGLRERVSKYYPGAGPEGSSLQMAPPRRTSSQCGHSWSLVTRSS